MNDLKKSVEVVGAPWKSSSYYETAEKWTHVFWEPHTRFRQLFNRLDLTSTLELACGYGRHAERTAPLCGRLVLMDIHEDNLAACRQRLTQFSNVEYFLNNGFDFQPVPDGSLSSIYCYDAMVHFSPDIVESYLRDCGRVLRPGGMALFHHSNYPAPTDRHYGQNPHARNHMTVALFADYARKAGLAVEESKTMRWGLIDDLDALTLIRNVA
jgi:SAM-dependent methyltransferase